MLTGSGLPLLDFNETTCIGYYIMDSPNIMGQFQCMYFNSKETPPA